MSNHNKNESSRHLVDILHNRYSAWIVLCVSLVITVVAWQVANQFAEQRARERFNFQVDDAQYAIEKRMLDYQQVLRGGLGLFQAVPNVDRTTWKTYVESLKLNENYQGIQGVGFSLWFSPEQKNAVEQRIRAEGFPDFAIKPAGERAQYSSIIYLEPFDTRNRRAFGFDMFSEVTRRTAMERARDTGEPAMSGKVKLMQETTTDIQPGFLLYLPLYDRPVKSVEERRAHLQGFVYSPFRIRDLLAGILGRGSAEINFQIYDNQSLSDEALLYDSQSQDKQPHKQPSTFNDVRTLTVAGHTWTIRYSSTPVLDSVTENNQPLVVAFGGCVIDLLLFYIILSLSKLRIRADQLAEERMKVLRQQELHFKTIADTANEGILTCNQRGEIIYCNNTALDIFGYKQEDIMGKSLTMLSADNSLAHLIKNDENVVIPTSLELQGMRQNGSTVPLDFSIATWCDNDNCYTTIIVRDITERKRIDQMKSEFISTVSHELRTPLTSIGGSLKLIESSALDDANKHQLIEIATRNCERLTRLINDILDIEKMEAGKMMFDIRPYSTSQLMTTAIEQNRSVATMAQVKLEMGVIEEGVVQVDSDRFQQVATNLIANAIKFSPVGATVTIACQRVGTNMRFTIQDEGPGIPENFRHNIFGKFSQADSSDTRQKGGTGLGLAISKKIVECFGGTMSFESEEGHGTLFYYDIALVEDKAA